MSWRAWQDHDEVGQSASWASGGPQVSVVAATCNRAAWLPDLLAALAAQTADVELVVVDDASDDGTSEQLTRLLAETRLPALALRTRQRSGPSAARNAGAARARGEVLLFTDDDCLPDPAWAAELSDALRAGTTVVQGATSPVDADHGPWDRSITVAAPSGLYETCNLGVVASAFRQVGGFADLGLLQRPGARGFGEDAELGSRLARLGSAGWAPRATVRHRWLPGTFADHLEGRRRLAGFPRLARLVPELERRLVGGVLLSPRTGTTDLALLGAAAAVLSPWAAVAVVPWVARLREEARGRPGRPLPLRMTQLAAADVVGAFALAEGSWRARRLVL